MKKVILDTSFILDAVKFKIDLDDIMNIINQPYEILIPDAVIHELMQIAKNKGKTGSNAKVALEIIKKKKFKLIKTSETSADRAILTVADKDVIVGTSDKKLKESLKKRNINLILVRAKKHLSMG